MDNPSSPYAAPKAALKDAPNEPGSPLKAVVLGVVTDILGTIVASTVIGIIFSVVWANQGMDAKQIEMLLSEQAIDKPFGMLATAVGAIFSYLGGFICARVVRRSELRYACITAAISITIGVVLAAGATSALRLLGGSAIGITAVLIGAMHARAANRSEDA